MNLATYPSTRLAKTKCDQHYRLVARGKLKGGTGQDRDNLRGTTLRRTINRFVSTLAASSNMRDDFVCYHALHVPPTRGFEKAPEPVDPDKYFRPERGRTPVGSCTGRRPTAGRNCPALILLGFHTGCAPRQPSTSSRWADISFRSKEQPLYRGQQKLGDTTCCTAHRALPRGTRETSRWG